MIAASDVFEAAMGLMDELSAAGEARTADTQAYADRAPAILNMLTAERRTLTGEGGRWLPLQSLEDMLPEADAGYALGAMAYGLAANLLVDENAPAASFFQQRYEELRNLYAARRPASPEAIRDVYGGLGHGTFSQW